MGDISELAAEVLTMDADREEWEAVRKRPNKKRPLNAEHTDSKKQTHKGLM